MKLADINQAKALAERRVKMDAMRARLEGEPLRLVLGRGSGEVEVVITDQHMARIQRDALAAIGEDIARIDTQLAAMGVEI